MAEPIMPDPGLFDSWQEWALEMNKVLAEGLREESIERGDENAIQSGLDPIGTIKAWHKTGLGGIPAPPLSSQWAECNGQILNDLESIWNGETIPDLNGDIRFLRGAATSGTKQAEDTSASALGLSGTSGAESGHTHLIQGSSSGAHNPGASGRVDANLGAQSSASLGSSGHTHGVGSYAVTGGSETRPINMSVVWIMRVK